MQSHQVLSRKPVLTLNCNLNLRQHLPRKWRILPSQFHLETQLKLAVLKAVVKLLNRRPLLESLQPNLQGLVTRRFQLQLRVLHPQLKLPRLELQQLQAHQQPQLHRKRQSWLREPIMVTLPRSLRRRNWAPRVTDTSSLSHQSNTTITISLSLRRCGLNRA